jgi:acyl-CoA synthetase (AMP-forming)/AMP-acid ligase II
MEFTCHGLHTGDSVYQDEEGFYWFLEFDRFAWLQAVP